MVVQVEQSELREKHVRGRTVVGRNTRGMFVHSPATPDQLSVELSTRYVAGTDLYKRSAYKVFGLLTRAPVSDVTANGSICMHISCFLLFSLGLLFDYYARPTPTGRGH